MYIRVLVLLLFCLHLPVLYGQTSENSNLESEEISINFRNVDIRVIIESFARILNKNISIDPRVRGNITILAEEPIRGSQMYDVLLMILSLNGFAAVENEYVTIVIPTPNAPSIVPKSDTGVGYERIIEIIEVDNVPVNSVSQVLQPFISQQSLVQIIPGSNKILIFETAINIERIKKIIDDVDKISISEYDFINLQYASASEALRILRTVFSRNPALRLEIDRTNNRLLVISNSLEARLAIRAMVSEIDIPPEGDSTTGNLRVFYLKYANAEELAPIITSLVNSDAINALQLDNEDNNQPTPTIPGQPSPQNRPPPPRTPTRQPQQVTDIRSTRERPVISIQADEKLNALIVAGDTTVIVIIERLLELLDIPRAQILIEVIAAEVSDNFLNEHGFDFAVASNNGGAVVTDLTGRFNLSGLTDAAEAGGLSTGVLAGALQSSISGGNPGSGAVGIGGANFDSNGNLRWAGILAAIQSDSQSNVLATPYLTTLDNEEASLNVGEERPFVTGSYTSSNGSVDNPFQTIERETVGIEITITPQINGDSTVTLQLEQIFSAVQDDTQLGVITTNREIRTSVTAPSSEIIVMGGLKQTIQNNVIRKVPFLGDIPLLGFFFRYERVQEITTNLIIFMRPTILDEGEDIFDANYQKYNSFREDFNLTFPPDHPVYNFVDQFFATPTIGATSTVVASSTVISSPTASTSNSDSVDNEN